MELENPNGQLALPAPEQRLALPAPEKKVVVDTGEPVSSKPDFYVGPDGPSDTIPSTAYRYERYLNDDGTPYKWGQDMIKKEEAPVTFFGFKKIETGKEARDAFQVKGPDKLDPLIPDDKSWSDARLRGEFDMLQLFENGELKARHPKRLGDTEGQPLEPFTEAYPEYGKGGAEQMHADRKIIQFDKVDILPEE